MCKLLVNIVSRHPTKGKRGERAGGQAGGEGGGGGCGGNQPDLPHLYGPAGVEQLPNP